MPVIIIDRLIDLKSIQAQFFDMLSSSAIYLICRWLSELYFINCFYKSHFTSFLQQVIFVDSPVKEMIAGNWRNLYRGFLHVISESKLSLGDLESDYDDYIVTLTNKR